MFPAEADLPGAAEAVEDDDAADFRGGPERPDDLLRHVLRGSARDVQHVRRLHLEARGMHRRDAGNLVTGGRYGNPGLRMIDEILEARLLFCGGLSVEVG